MTRARLNDILEGSDPQHGRTFATFTSLVIVAAAISFTIGTLPNLSATALRILGWLDVAIVTIFATEYALRLYAAPNRLRYAFSFWGLIDLLSFAPALILSGTSLQSARLLRLILLARLFKLARVTHAIDTLLEALEDIWEQLAIFILMLLIILFLTATGIYFFENEAQPEAFASVPHALWWAIATLTTVGYGDIVPITAGGKIFTGIVLLIGLAIVAVPTGLISAALVDKTRKGRDDPED
ncbi:MAG: ion transporter [Pseudomonadota bacterium]